MHNGLKNLQSASRSAARRERLEQGHSMHGYDDDSGISGIGLTPVDDLDASYSSPETSSVHSQHSGGSGGGGYGMMTIAYGSAQHAHAAAGYSSSYGSSVSSSAAAAAAAAHGYTMHGHPHHSQDSSPYMSDAQRLSSGEISIEAIIHPPGRGRATGPIRASD